MIHFPSLIGMIFIFIGKEGILPSFFLQKTLDKLCGDRYNKALEQLLCARAAGAGRGPLRRFPPLYGLFFWPKLKKRALTYFPEIATGRDQSSRHLSIWPRKMAKLDFLKNLCYNIKKRQKYFRTAHLKFYKIFVIIKLRK